MRCIVYIVLTDSGGVIEQAVTLERPVGILRRVTERNAAFFTAWSMSDKEDYVN